MLRRRNMISAVLSSAKPAPAEAGVRNYYNPVTTPTINIGYQSDGSTTALQAFATSGLVAVVSGQIYTLSLDSGADNWVLDTGGVHYYNGSQVHTSYDTSGPVYSADSRLVKFTSPITGYMAVNLKYTIGGAYSSSNIIPSGALTLLLSKIMMNKGSQACILTAYGASGVTDTASGTPDLATKLEFITSGDTTFYLTGYISIKNMAQRMITRAQGYDGNPGYEFRSITQIPPSTPTQATPGAFNDNFTPAPSDTDTIYIQSDNMPAYRMNGVFCGGAHATPSWILTKTSHGKTNANCRGSIWSNGVGQYQCTRIIDANRLVFTKVITGAADLWTFSDAGLAGTGTMTHVSGASSTGSIAWTAAAATQLWPMVQNFSIKQWAGRNLIQSDGAHPARNGRVKITYDIVNQKSVQTYLTSIIGQSNDVFYNSPGLQSQTHIELEYQIDKNGATTANYYVKAIQDHFRDSMWATQHQAMTVRTASSETLWLFAEGCVSFQSGATQSGGSAKDFTASGGPDISSNSLEYYFDQSAAWASGSIWRDGIQRPPRLFMFWGKDSGGSIFRKYVIVVDEDEGRTAVNNYSTRVGLLSQFNKFYPYADYNRSISAGNSDVVVNAFGFIDPAGGGTDFVNFAYPKSGGRYGYVYYTLSGALSNHAVYVGIEHAGKPIRVTRCHVNLTLISTEVSSTGYIAVSSTGAGGFAAVLG